MPSKPKLLIVEDEPAIRAGLVDVFVFHGFEVEFAATGPAGLELALTGKFDMLLLDVMLPGLDGFAICERVRAMDREQPIIMLTAKGADEDVIQGLALGADDYVTKPFSVAQLVLRVQAVLRRSRLGIEHLQVLVLADGTRIDTENLSGERDGRELAFTRREMDILLYLQANAHRPASRQDLLHKVWGYARDLDIETRTVDIHIAKLRRKIERNPREPVNLLTVRGAGYRLMVG